MSGARLSARARNERTGVTGRREPIGCPVNYDAWITEPHGAWALPSPRRREPPTGITAWHLPGCGCRNYRIRGAGTTGSTVPGAGAPRDRGPVPQGAGGRCPTVPGASAPRGRGPVPHGAGGRCPKGSGAGAPQGRGCLVQGAGTTGSKVPVGTCRDYSVAPAGVTAWHLPGLQRGTCRGYSVAPAGVTAWHLPGLQRGTCRGYSVASAGVTAWHLLGLQRGICRRGGATPAGVTVWHLPEGSVCLYLGGRCGLCGGVNADGNSHLAWSRGGCGMV
jgi:hypothetical protein